MTMDDDGDIEGVWAEVERREVMVPRGRRRKRGRDTGVVVYKG